MFATQLYTMIFCARSTIANASKALKGILSTPSRNLPRYSTSVDQTHFVVLDVGPPRFDIDLGELKRKWLLEQQKYHPDRAQPSSSSSSTIDRSAIINKAYEVLKDPLSRASYLVRD